jgi:hypothetical protein
MSFTATQTLDDASGDDVTYVLISQDANGTRRLNSASTLAEPADMIVRHSVQGSGQNAVDRHLIQFTWTKLDTAGVPRKATINFTVAVPRSTVITSTMVNDMIANLVDFIADGGFTTSGFAGVTNLTALLRGES